MSSAALEKLSGSTASDAAVAFQYHGIHVHNHCRTQGVILATSEHEARLLLRRQDVAALSISLISAANPLVSAHVASTYLSSPLPQLIPSWLTPWLTAWTQNQNVAWRNKTLELLAAALEQRPLLPALAAVERQLSLLKAPALWPAAVLLWRDGLTKGASCYEALQPFASVWEADWLAWVCAAESQGSPLAALIPWLQVQHYRQQQHATLRPTIWRCYGWGIVLALLLAVIIVKHPHQASVIAANAVSIAIPLIVGGAWLLNRIGAKGSFTNNRWPWNVLCSHERRHGWNAWWIAIHLQANNTQELSPLEALQLAVHIPSAQNAHWLHATLAAIESGKAIETTLSQLDSLPVTDRLRFEAVYDSNGLKHSIEACWHEAETEWLRHRLCGWIALDLILTTITIGLGVLLLVPLCRQG